MHYVFATTLKYYSIDTKAVTMINLPTFNKYSSPEVQAQPINKNCLRENIKQSFVRSC